MSAPTSPAQEPMATYEIDGEQVGLPVHVGDAVVGSATFAADADAVGEALPDGLVPTRVAGRAMAVVAVCRYRENDLGPYDEVAVCLLCEPAGGGPKGAYVAHLPVSAAFSQQAGQQIWGFPKTLDDLDVRIGRRAMGGRWARDGELIAQLTVPYGGGRTVGRRSLTAYTNKDGRPHAVEFAVEGQGMRAGIGGARLELGSHPVAERLRRLGLSRHALMTSSLRTVQGDFGPAVPVR